MLAQCFQMHGMDALDPLTIETFIDYGLWFQKQAVPDVDETYVASIERRGQQFEVTLVDGRRVMSPVVVMAPGLAYYINRLAEFFRSPAQLVTHQSAH